MYIVEEEADDPEGKKRRQVILKRADLQGSSEASETEPQELSSGSGRWEGVSHTRKGCTMQPGAGAAVEILHVLRGLLQTLGFPLCKEELQTGKGPGPPSEPWLPISICCPSTGDQFPSCYRSPPSPAGVNPKTPSGCLKSQIV